MNELMKLMNKDRPLLECGVGRGFHFITVKNKYANCDCALRLVRE